jgi:hypothetical protein
MVSKATMRFPDDDDGRQKPRGAPSLKQWARLYRAASRVDGLDAPGLERLARRLYQKPLAELSMLEAAGLIGMLKAAARGALDLKLAGPAPRAFGKRLDL